MKIKTSIAALVRWNKKAAAMSHRQDYQSW
jgi:hypothetical protein